MAHLVTRYNKKTNDLDVIGIGSDAANALNLVSQDVQKSLPKIITKQYGWLPPYSMNFIPYGVEIIVDKKTLLLYTLSAIPRNQLVEVTNF
jgi:hypothetical protein